MYAIMTAVSPLTSIYFILIVVFGGFFVVNLFLAVIFEARVAPWPHPNRALTTPRP